MKGRLAGIGWACIAVQVLGPIAVVSSGASTVLQFFSIVVGMLFLLSIPLGLIFGVTLVVRSELIGYVVTVFALISGLFAVYIMFALTHYG